MNQKTLKNLNETNSNSNYTNGGIRKDKTINMNIEELKEEIQSGNISSIIGLAKLKDIAKEVKQAIEGVELEAKEEASKYESTFQLDGYKIEQRSGGKMFDFKHLEDWQTYNKALKDCEERYKIAFSAYSKGITSINEDGEVQEMPNVTYKKDSLVFKKLKQKT